MFRFLCSKFALSREEDVIRNGFRLHAQRGSNELLRCFDSVPAGSSSILQSSWQEVPSLLINILDRHELLVEDNLLVNVRGLHTDDPADIFEDHKTEWHIFPEESSLQVQSHLARVRRIFWNHWEGHSAVAEVRVEDSLQV